jgi:hypothetical protein
MINSRPKSNHMRIYVRFMEYKRVDNEYFAGLVEGPHDRLDQGDCEIHDVGVVEEKIGLWRETVEA